MIPKEEPAFRKWTPAVERGIVYAITQLEFDAEHSPIDPETGNKLSTIDNKDLLAAAEWLRAQTKKREN